MWQIFWKTHPKKPHRSRVVLALEAKNVAIILSDADLDSSISEIITGTLSFNGQRCTALQMIFVHRKIMPEFMRMLNDAMCKLKLGMPWDKECRHYSSSWRGKMWIPCRPCWWCWVSKGASVVNRNGGEHFGNFFNPAVVFPVTSEMRLYHEEQFGPVIPVAAFDDIEEPSVVCDWFKLWPAGKRIREKLRPYSKPHRSACKTRWRGWT